MDKAIVLLHLTAPILGLLVNTLVQILTCRLIKSVGLLKSVVGGFVIGFATVMACGIAWYLTAMPDVMELMGQSALNLLTYVALGYCYFHFINLGETARRIRILRELQESENGLTLEGILERYNAFSIINVRLQRMISNKQIVLQEGRYYIGNPVMLYMAKILILLKWILLRRRSELE